ncbi:MAG: septal ring lytic transglycosylase RlpA family protein [Desulfovermiculus sp.]
MIGQALPHRLCVLAYLLPFALAMTLSSCSIVKLPYTVSKHSLKTAYTVTKVAGKTVWGTAKVLTTVGGYTFQIVTAPLSWPLTHDEIETIAGMPPKEAIAKGKVKNAPYVVAGRRYVPMSVAKSASYREQGTASWYGNETLNQAGGHMTANGEAFDPEQLTAAHKHLPLPTYVRVTNLGNKRSIIVRVNDRGPFVSGRIIDLSAGAARRLGFYNQGTTEVLVETVATAEG